MLGSQVKSPILYSCLSMLGNLQGILENKTTMNSMIRLGFLLAILISILTGCGCKHEWKEANCTTPKTCSLCNETEGSPASHSWSNATCTAPKTCDTCGITEGELLPHIPGEWTTFKTEYVTAKRLMVQQCKDCDEILDENIIVLEQMHDGTHFLLSAEDYAERLVAMMQPLQEGYGEYTAEIVEESDGKAQLNIYCTNGRIRETVGELSFGIGGDELDYDQKDAENSYIGVGGIISSDHLNVIMPALVQTTDPTMDIEEIFSLAGEWISNRSTTRNGIAYDIVAGNETAAALMISLAS